ncbi:hypothetical protein F090043F1_08700 [Parabacteroides goldsteinii]
MSEYKYFSLGVRCKLYIDIYLHLTPNSDYSTLQLGCTTRFVNLQKYRNNKHYQEIASLKY